MITSVNKYLRSLVDILPGIALGERMSNADGASRNFILQKKTIVSHKMYMRFKIPTHQKSLFVITAIIRPIQYHIPLHMYVIYNVMYVSVITMDII